MDNTENLPIRIQKLWQQSNIHFLHNITYIQIYDKILLNRYDREDTILTLYEMKYQFNRHNNNKIDNDEIIFLAISLFDSYIMKNDLKISLPLFIRANWQTALWYMTVEFTHTGLNERFNAEEIKTTQFELISGLKHNCKIPNTFRILKEYTEYLSVNRKAYVLAEFLLTMMLFHTKSLYHKNIYLALAALCFSCQRFDTDNHEKIVNLLNKDQRTGINNALEMINYCLRSPLHSCIDLIHKYGTAEYLHSSRVCYSF